MRSIQRPTWIRPVILAIIAVICASFAYLLLHNILSEPGRRVVFIFVLAIFFWGLEIIPLYATSLFIVLLLSLLLATPLGVRLKFFLIPFASPIIMLFLGGLILAVAAQKHHVDLYLLEKMFARLGQRS